MPGAGGPGRLAESASSADETSAQALAADARLPLISATGSCAMGRAVGRRVAAAAGPVAAGTRRQQRLDPDANRPNLDLALRAIVFAAVGTAGQRCTTLRRLIVHESIVDAFARLVARLSAAFSRNPWDEGVLLGPLIRERGRRAVRCGSRRRPERKAAKIVCGGSRIDRPGFYVEPTIVRANADMAIVKQETFAPILYVMPYKTLDEAIAMHNSVPQGLSIGHLYRPLPRGGAVPVGRRAATAASPTSTSAPAARRSAGLSAARKKPAAAAKPAATPGKPTCAARPARSTTAATCRWRKA